MSRHLRTDVFETWYGDRDYSTLHSDISLDELDLQSRSQLYKQSKNVSVHLLANLSIDMDEIQYVAATCWFLEAQAKFILRKEYSRERTLLALFDEIYI